MTRNFSCLLMHAKQGSKLGHPTHAGGNGGLGGSGLGGGRGLGGGGGDGGDGGAGGDGRNLSTEGGHTAL